ncbi:cytochrome P450 3A24-like [Octopus vulgaris]|uniref:Cytochrome P450 3A24-like n=1 Tax=Octopus vulgaris TaxID=6645 RepID=A0AA36FKL1_OCTVU|nr:cytochrome P450 3A24-like [Octopus vulgaris]
MNVFGLTEYVTTFVLGAVLLLALYLYGRRPYSYFKELGIPGPEPICYLGNLKEIGKRGNGYAYKHFREIYGNLYGLFFGRLPICVTSDPEFIQEILVKQFSNFTNRTVLFGDEISQLTLPLTKDDHWKYLRTVLTPTFTSHQMRRMNTMIQTYANILVEKFGNLADNGEIREVKTYIRITDDEILAQCVVLFLSGYETTASALSFFTYLMAINSKSQQRLYEEIVDSLGEDLPTYDNIQQLPYLSMCFDETMRMYPILNTAVRQCKKTCTVKGTKIPEGLSVRISIDALHYDPKYWPEPDKFIPESRHSLLVNIVLNSQKEKYALQRTVGIFRGKFTFTLSAFVSITTTFNLFDVELNLWKEWEELDPELGK